MEVSNRISPQQNVQRSETAKDPDTAKVAAKLPEIEARAAPEVEKLEPADLDAAMQDLQQFIQGLGRDLSFRRDESLERSIITVFDSNTKEVVRQIPSEEVVAIARQIRSDLDQLRAGMFMDTKI